GIDVYFDNVGGRVSEAVLPLLRQNARVVVCGQISEYGRQTPPRRAPWLSLLLQKPARVQGFIVTEFAHYFPVAFRCLRTWVQRGRLRYRESIEHGLENAPSAFIGMLEGHNIGKQLVKLTDD